MRAGPMPDAWCEAGHRCRAGRAVSTLGCTVLLAALVTLAGCIVVPQTREVYDPECRLLTRQMTLQAAYVGGFQHCAGEGCLALLSAAGAVTAVSAVVSGSIALVGNVVFWFERQGQCLRAPPPGAAAPALGSPAAAASAPQ